MIRLQGKAMAEMKPLLRIIGYYVSDNDNIKAVMKYKKGLDKNCYIKFSHWLNDDEKERFLKSEYYKTHEPMSNEQLYGKKYLKRQEYLKRKEQGDDLTWQN